MSDSLEISKLYDDLVDALEVGDKEEIQKRLANLKKVIHSADADQRRSFWQYSLLDHPKFVKALSEKKFDIVYSLLDSLEEPGNADLIEGIRQLTYGRNNNI